jgi:hypothetical protein
LLHSNIEGAKRLRSIDTIAWPRGAKRLQRPRGREHRHHRGLIAPSTSGISQTQQVKKNALSLTVACPYAFGLQVGGHYNCYYKKSIRVSGWRYLLLQPSVAPEGDLSGPVGWRHVKKKTRSQIANWATTRDPTQVCRVNSYAPIAVPSKVMCPPAVQGVARAIRRANLRLRLTFLANYIQTMFKFCLNYY